MRQRILTVTEKKELRKFFESSKSSTIVRMLKYRAKRFLPTLKEEIALLEKLLQQRT